jgi:hypothetical protein
VRGTGAFGRAGTCALIATGQHVTNANKMVRVGSSLQRVHARNIDVDFTPMDGVRRNSWPHSNRVRKRFLRERSGFAGMVVNFRFEEEPE